jgi:hypothetical protein
MVGEVLSLFNVDCGDVSFLNEEGRMNVPEGV